MTKEPFGQFHSILYDSFDSPKGFECNTCFERAITMDKIKHLKSCDIRKKIAAANRKNTRNQNLRKSGLAKLTKAEIKALNIEHFVC